MVAGGWMARMVEQPSPAGRRSIFSGWGLGRRLERPFRRSYAGHQNGRVLGWEQ